MRIDVFLVIFRVKRGIAVIKHLFARALRCPLLRRTAAGQKADSQKTDGQNTGSFFHRYIPPCFDGDKVQLFNHKEIIEELYISCFGISNLPVTLWGKLYKTSVITEAMKSETIVKFMGDDLSIMLNVLPLCEQLVVLPKIVYNYSVGGNTSRFMPYMLEDFLALYQYKTKLAARYLMPYNIEELMDIELINIVRSYLIMCATAGKYTETQLYEQIKEISSNQIIRKAADNTKNIELSGYIRKGQFDIIAESIWQSVRKDKLKNRLKKFLFSI